MNGFAAQLINEAQHPIDSLDDVDRVLRLFDQAATIVADVKLVLSDAPGATAALDRLANRVIAGWTGFAPEPDDHRRAVLRGIGQAALRASQSPLPSAFSPRDALVIAKLERALGQDDIAGFWDAVTQELVPAPRPLRLSNGRVTYWALPMKPVDLVPPAFAVWWDRTVRRCVRAELRLARPSREWDEYDDEATADPRGDLLSEVGADIDRPVLVRRFLSEVEMRCGNGIYALAKRRCDGSVAGRTAQEVGAILSTDIGREVPVATVWKWDERLRRLAEHLGF